MLAETNTVWAVSISLAATPEITIVFSSCAYLDVSVQRVRLLYGYAVFNCMGCPIRKFRDQYVFATPPNLSQLITSFFASQSLGIPRVPLITYQTLVLLYFFTTSINSNMSMNFFYSY